MKNNLFLLALLCLAMVLPGCLKDPDCPSAGSSGDGKLRMTLSIGNMEEIETRSVASSQERSIVNLVVLIFDKTTGQYSDGEIVSPENLQGTDGAQLRTVTVNLAPAEGDKVVILANYDPGITTIPLTQGTSTTAEINNLFSYPSIISGKIVQPMSGEFIVPASGTPTCQLTRSMCKVELNISKDLTLGSIVGGFTMKHWQVYNMLDMPWGAIYSESPTACTVKSGITNSSFVNAPNENTQPDGGSWYLAEYPVSTKAKVAAVSDTQFHTDRTCLIITTTTGTYYRLDLFDHLAKKFIDIRRNTHIKISINKVLFNGYSTVAEALASPGGNIEYDIQVDGENDGVVISSGSYALSLSNGNMTIYTDEKEFDLEVCTARYILSAGLPSLPAGITNQVVFRYPDRDNSEFTILTSTITNADTPIKIHVRRKLIGSSPSTDLNVCLGNIVYQVPVFVLPALHSGSSIAFGTTAAYRWIKMAEGVTFNETERKVYVEEAPLRWVRYDAASGNKFASTEDYFDALPLLESRSAELEVFQSGSISRYRINVAPVGLYAGWFGGDPMGGTGDTGGPRFSKRLLVDAADAPTDLVWASMSDDVGGIARDREQGKAITKLLGGKGSTYDAAYYCYMKNDTNKNGLIDADEPIDWYLPAQNQLVAVWIVMQKLNAAAFGSYSYWSATEIDSDRVWYLDFRDMGVFDGRKYFNYHVRCVRDF